MTTEGTADLGVPWMDGAGPRWVYFVLSWPPIGEYGEERVPVFSTAARGSSGCLESKRN